jgi:putative acetyltransferase
MEPQSDEHALAPTKSEIVVSQDDVSRPEVITLLNAHIAALQAINNRLNNQLGLEIGHVLDLSALRRENITMFTARNAISNEIMGCAALKQLSTGHGELKSMRTAESHQRKGVAGALIKHLLDEAMTRGYRRLSLETGPWEEFEAARALYAKHGFVPCGPYEGYEDTTPDELSVFMTYYLSQPNPTPKQENSK